MHRWPVLIACSSLDQMEKLQACLNFAMHVAHVQAWAGKWAHRVGAGEGETLQQNWRSTQGAIHSPGPQQSTGCNISKDIQHHSKGGCLCCTQPFDCTLENSSLEHRLGPEGLKLSKQWNAGETNKKVSARGESSGTKATGDLPGGAGGPGHHQRRPVQSCRETEAGLYWGEQSL